ncbi:MAG: hypothetical protein HEP71_03355 [Roseivirga sp.]|nr:hypothetical protein [Roseivirga sp.]
MSLLLCLAISNAQAQERKKELALTGGFATKITDPIVPEPSHGFHLGVNLYNRNAGKFSADAQFSLNYTADRRGSTNRLTINALYGVRMYFSSLENNTRVFMNLLAGFAFRNETGDDFTENIPDIGYSGGLYLENGRYLFGVSVDAPTNVIFKLGYTF